MLTCGLRATFTWGEKNDGERLNVSDLFHALAQLREFGFVHLAARRYFRLDQLLNRNQFILRHEPPITTRSWAVYLAAIRVSAPRSDWACDGAGPKALAPRSHRPQSLCSTEGAQTCPQSWPRKAPLNRPGKRHAKTWKDAAVSSSLLGQRFGGKFLEIGERVQRHFFANHDALPLDDREAESNHVFGHQTHLPFQGWIDGHHHRTFAPQMHSA